MTKQVEVFTDGSCLGNPGPGRIWHRFALQTERKAARKRL